MVFQPTGPISSIEADKKLIEKWEAMIAEVQEKETKAKALGKTDEGRGWEAFRMKKYKAICKLKQAIEAEGADKPEEAQKWRKTAEYYKRSAELYLEAVKAYKQGKEEEAASWNGAATALNNVAINLEKVIEAESAGKSEEVQKWCKTVEQTLRSVELYTQSARAHREKQLKVKNSQGRK